MDNSVDDGTGVLETLFGDLSSPTAAAAAPASPGILDTMGSWVNDLGNLFNSGLGLYTAADQKLTALKSIKEDTVTPKPTAIQTISAGVASLPAWVVPVAIGGVVLLLILVARKLR